MSETTRNVPIGNYLIEAILPQTKKRRGYKVVIFFFTLIIYTCYHISRKPISVVKSVLHENCSEVAQREHFIINKNNETFCDWSPFDKENWSALLGNLDLLYLLSYALTMFLSGHIAERVNIRYFLSFGMIMCGITTSLFGLGFYWKIHVYYYYVIVQIFAGMFQATGWPSVVACMGNWFGKSKRGFFMGLWNCHTSLGNIIGSVVAGIFVQYAWGLSFIVPGIIVASMGVVVFFFLTPYPEDVGCRQPKTHSQFFDTMHSAVAIIYPGGDAQDQSLESSCVTEIESINHSEDELLLPRENERSNVSFLQALLIPGVIEYSLCLFFAKLVSYTFLFWLPSYIKASGRFDPSQAADLSAIMDFGGIIGGVIAGVLSDVTGSSAITCAGMLIISVPYLYIFFLYGVTSLASCIGLLVVLGVIVNGPYALITTAVSADLGTHETLKGNSRAVATVTAIIDGTGSLGAALGPLLTGILMPSGWKLVFIMLMVATMLAILLLSRRVYKETIHLIVERRRKKLENVCQEKDYA